MSKQTGIICANCKEILNHGDDIFGTSCGHLYHFLCLRDNPRKSPNCLHCKPLIFKMFLEFTEISQPISLENQEEYIELCKKLEENKMENTFLKQSFTISQETVQKLEAKIKILKDALKAKENIEQEFEDRIATLEDLNKYLMDNNDASSSSETKSQNYNSKKKNHKENKWSRKKPNNFNNVQQQGKNKRNRYNHKEDIANKEQESNEIKDKEKKNILPITVRNQINLLDAEINAFKEKMDNKRDIAVKNQGRHHGEEISKNEQPPSGNELKEIMDSMPPNTVMIKNFRNIDFKNQNSIGTIIHLAKQMNLNISCTQIKDIFVFCEQPNLYTLAVEFSDKKTKDEFIKKSVMLRSNAQTKYLEIV